MITNVDYSMVYFKAIQIEWRRRRKRWVGVYTRNLGFYMMLHCCESRLCSWVVVEVVEVMVAISRCLSRVAASLHPLLTALW